MRNLFKMTSLALCAVMLFGCTDSGEGCVEESNVTSNGGNSNAGQTTNVQNSNGGGGGGGTLQIRYDFTSFASTNEEALTTTTLTEMLAATAKDAKMTPTVVSTTFAYSSSATGGPVQGSGFIKMGKSGAENDGVIELSFGQTKITKVVIDAIAWGAFDVWAVVNNDVDNAPELAESFTKYTFNIAEASTVKITGTDKDTTNTFAGRYLIRGLEFYSA